MMRAAIFVLVLVTGPVLSFAEASGDCRQGAHRDSLIRACTAQIATAGGDRAKLLSAYSLRGAAYQAKGDHELAVVDLTRALQDAPRDANLWYLRGLSHTALGQNIRCAADYSLALRYDVRLTKALIERGECYRRLGVLERAMADQSEALKLDPGSAVAMANRAYAALRNGQLDEAIADAEQAIRLDSRSAKGYLTRGLAREKSDRPQAVADVRKALELDPALKSARELQQTLRNLGV